MSKGKSEEIFVHCIIEFQLPKDSNDLESQVEFLKALEELFNDSAIHEIEYCWELKALVKRDRTQLKRSIESLVENYNDVLRFVKCRMYDLVVPDWVYDWSAD